MQADTLQHAVPNTGWCGGLQLKYADIEGTTQIIQSRSHSPLKVQRPFYPEGEVCHSVILHTSGGMVGGDRLEIDVHLQPQAHVLLTTAAASKIYRTNGQQAQQKVQINLAAGACLEWLLQETIVFNQAVYRQDLHIELAPGATWLGWEITRFGRSARQEQFLQGNWRSHTEVWQQERPLWIDRQWLPGSKEVFNSPNALASHPVVGTMAWIGQAVEPEVIAKIRLWTDA